ncbi:hypothetical protein Droror1_Dr00010772 [Drosera rotundifolia]
MGPTEILRTRCFPLEVSPRDLQPDHRSHQSSFASFHKHPIHTSSLSLFPGSRFHPFVIQIAITVEDPILDLKAESYCSLIAPWFVVWIRFGCWRTSWLKLLAALAREWLGVSGLVDVGL